MDMKAEMREVANGERSEAPSSSFKTGLLSEVPSSSCITGCLRILKIAILGFCFGFGGALGWFGVKLVFGLFSENWYDLPLRISIWR